MIANHKIIILIVFNFKFVCFFIFNIFIIFPLIILVIWHLYNQWQLYLNLQEKIFDFLETKLNACVTHFVGLNKSPSSFKKSIDIIWE